MAGMRENSQLEA